MIRSSKLKLKYANNSKLNTALSLFEPIVIANINELINDLIYNHNKIPALPTKEIASKLPFSARINQLIAKEASAVARSIRNKLKENGNLHKYQHELLTKFKDKTLKVNWNGNLNLDSRFVSIEENKSSVEFDYWIVIKYPSKSRVSIPIKLTRHMKHLISRDYKLKTNSIRICQNGSIALYFERDDYQSSGTSQLGIDVGRNKSFITNTGIAGTESKAILNALKHKKHVSKNKISHIQKLKQVIDKEIKQLDLIDVNQVMLEKLTGMKPGKRWGNINHHWSYSYIQNRIEQRCEEHGVRVRYIHAAYTSQTCSSCGHTDKKSRNGELFICMSCGIEIDADLNAANNILHRGTNSGHVHKKLIANVDNVSYNGNYYVRNLCKY